MIKYFKALHSKSFLLSCAALTIAACSPDNSNNAAVITDTEATAHTATAEHNGSLKTAQGIYKFTPRSCFFHQENGEYDIEIEGPGEAPDGEKLYFDLTSTGNAVSVKLGVDSRYTSSDRKLMAGQHVSQPFTFNVSDQVLSIAKLILVDENGNTVDENASLTINCSQ